jgi:hypothetical protein
LEADSWQIVHLQVVFLIAPYWVNRREINPRGEIARRPEEKRKTGSQALFR